MGKFRVTTKPSITYFGIDVELKTKLSVLIGDSAIGKSYSCKALVARNNGNIKIKVVSNKKELEELSKVGELDLLIFDNSELYFTSIAKTKEIYNSIKDRVGYIIVIAHGNWRYDLIAGEYTKLNLSVDYEKRVVSIHG